MRTTVELDDDLVQELRDRLSREGGSLRKALNVALRKGLSGSRRQHPAARYRCPVVHMGMPVSPGIDLDKALALAAALEDAETAGELERRK
jgi:hypothetical protein